jgi:hypothetical protein
MPKFSLAAKAHGPQHAHRVFLVAVLRVADQADQAIAHVVHAVGVIENALADRIVVQGVDGEVAALRVFFQGAVDVVAQNAAAGVMRGTVAVFLVVFRVIGAEGGDFDDFAAEMDVDQLEAAPMMRALRNSARTCSGVALVATSKSLGVMPSSRSRTQPPTR